MNKVPPVLIRLFVILALFFIIDYYVFGSIMAATASMKIGANRALIRKLFWGFCIFGYILIIGVAIGLGLQVLKANYLIAKIAFAGTVLIYTPKLILALFLISEDVYRIIIGTLGIQNKIANIDTGKSDFLIPRSEFLSRVGIFTASIPFFGIFHGITIGRWNFKVFRQTLEFDDLPDKFDGFTIAQISDIHSGSLDNISEVRRGIDLVLNQNTDVIFFTGDLVNNIVSEMDDWKNEFSRLKAPNGVYSILGNHDYGDYVYWKSAEDKKKNLADLINLQKEMGWQVLLNQNNIIEREGQKIAIVGVENWGKPPFPQLGDLNIAMAGLSKDDFKLLLSHDPSHWDAEVLGHSHKIHATFSGHTHGMQFGIEIAGFKWSPISFKYPRWAGLYEEPGHFLYVNRGFGTLGFPGRVGIFPEITVITLKRKNQTNT